MRSLMKWMAMSCCLVLAMGAQAQPGPDESIRHATQDLLGVVDEARGYFDDDPERFYAEVDRIIGPLVDFYSFSRGVMGRWGSKAYYDSLGSVEKKQQFDAEVEHFVNVFRTGLVRTYSKGLLAFSGETIEVLPVAADELGGGVATVVQIIHGKDGKSYTIRYKMRKDADQAWRVRNVSLDSLNLGKVYQNQFASSAGKYQGDIKAVIDSWSVSTASVGK